MGCSSVCTNQDNLIKDIKFFKEEIYGEVLSIPCQKPDMERILDVMITPTVLSVEVIETEKGRSFEGQYLSGYKLIIELEFNEKITYVAEEPTQCVHSANYTTMKSTFIVVPAEVCGKRISDLVNTGHISVKPIIEETCARMLDCRSIYRCMMIYVEVE